MLIIILGVGADNHAAGSGGAQFVVGFIIVAIFSAWLYKQFDEES